MSWDRACVACSIEQELYQGKCWEDLGAVAQLIAQELSWCAQAFPERAHKYFCADVSVSCVSQEQGTDVCWIGFPCSPSDSFSRWLVVSTQTRGKPLAECLTSIETNVFLVAYKCVIAWRMNFQGKGSWNISIMGYAGFWLGLLYVCLVCIQVQWEEYRAFFFPGLWC